VINTFQPGTELPSVESTATPCTLCCDSNGFANTNELTDNTFMLVRTGSIPCLVALETGMLAALLVLIVTASLQAVYWYIYHRANSQVTTAKALSSVLSTGAMALVGLQSTEELDVHAQTKKLKQQLTKVYMVYQAAVRSSKHVHTLLYHAA
jgi:hypothetical protein